MLTIFSTPKPFRGHSGIIQRNALRSWKLLHPDVEVILLGDEEGAAEVCTGLGVRHEPHVERSEQGTKYLNYLFARAQEIGRHDVLCYSNCDIVLMSDFWKAFEKVSAWRKAFLMVGQRWDLDISESWNFASTNWEAVLGALARARGFQRPTDTIDYFVFSRGLYQDMPPLVVGRIWWDHWLIWAARAQGVAVVDSSPAVVAVHQNHDHSYHPQGTEGVYRGPEAKRNYALAGNGRHLCTIEDATHQITPVGTLRRTPLRKQFFVTKNFLWTVFVQKTFPVRKRLRMRREDFRGVFKKDSHSHG